MGKLTDKIERALYGATTQERIDALAEHIVQGMNKVTNARLARLAAALELPDAARQCPACHGEGSVLANGGPGEKVCSACGGTGLREGA